MANEFRINQGPTTNQLFGIWHLTRAMKKAGWRHKASSNGSTKVVSDDPTADLWGGGTVTGASGSAASITTIEDHPYGKLMTLTGLSSLVSPTVAGGQSEGNILTLSGSATSANNGSHQIYQVISATSCKVLNLNNSAAIDNSGAITWTERNILTDAYPSLDSFNHWICMEGPETLQLSFTTSPTAEFIRGELVTQTGTNATGECLGTVYDSTAALGWMVIMPRTGQFNGTGLLTGSTSNTTVTPTNLYRYRRQMVFHHANSNSSHGSSWYQCVREDTESANLYSALAANAACTATVPPGGSITAGNRFPNVNYCVVMRCALNNTADGVTALVSNDGFYHKMIEGSALYPNGRIHVGVANAMPLASRSADGSWWLFHGNSNIAAPAAGTLFHWGRIDGQEPGDVEPYYIFRHCRASDASRVRAQSDLFTTSGSIKGTDGSDTYRYDTNSYVEWVKIVGRSVGTTYGGPGVSFDWPGWSTGQRSNTRSYFAINQGVTRAFDHPASIRPSFKEPLALGGGTWGRARWFFCAPQGSAFDTFESKRYMCIHGWSGSADMFALAIGPFDGTSNPLQS